MASTAASKRLAKEYLAMQKAPTEYIVAKPRCVPDLPPLISHPRLLGSRSEEA